MFEIEARELRLPTARHVKHVRMASRSDGSVTITVGKNPAHFWEAGGATALVVLLAAVGTMYWLKKNTLVEPTWLIPVFVGAVAFGALVHAAGTVMEGLTITLKAGRLTVRNRRPTSGDRKLICDVGDVQSVDAYDGLRVILRDGSSYSFMDGRDGSELLHAASMLRSALGMKTLAEERAEAVRRYAGRFEPMGVGVVPYSSAEPQVYADPDTGGVVIFVPPAKKRRVIRVTPERLRAEGDGVVIDVALDEVFGAGAWSTDEDGEFYSVRLRGVFGAAETMSGLSQKEALRVARTLVEVMGIRVPRWEE